eukprot:4257999-Lingulodinium_polyedra.AAC.1
MTPRGPAPPPRRRVRKRRKETAAPTATWAAQAGQATHGGPVPATPGARGSWGGSSLSKWLAFGVLR